MQRRQFIRIMGAGLITTTFATSLMSCSKFDEDMEYGWDDLSLEQNDFRLKLIAYAMLSPNPHNIQPWLIKLTSKNSFDLYVDQTRLLPETDPYSRQIHIGQGTFLESLSIAASGHGYQAEIHYFPQGEYSNQELVDKPVASILLIKQHKRVIDPLFEQLLIRQSNKREYDNHLLSDTEKSQLSAFYGKSNVPKISARLRFIDKPEESKYMQEALIEAMKIEGKNKQRDLETINMFRFNDQEIAQYRDGFGLAHSGVTGIRKTMVENLFISRESAEKDSSDFAKQSVDLTEKISLSTSSFAILTSTGNSRLRQVKVGREYCRLNLTSSAMGLAQHPMSQILQEYEDMLPLQKAFKNYFNITGSQTIQMLVRLGRAEKTDHTPRRSVKSIVI